MNLSTRLRVLADYIEQHQLPEPNVSLSPNGYTALHVDSYDDVQAWANVSGAVLDVQRAAAVSA